MFTFTAQRGKIPTKEAGLRMRYKVNALFPKKLRFKCFRNMQIDNSGEISLFQNK